MAATSLLFARASPLNRSLLIRHLRLAAGTDPLSSPVLLQRHDGGRVSEAGGEKLSLPSSSVRAEGVPSVTAKLLEVMDPRKDHRLDDPDYWKWKDKKGEILRDIEPIVTLTKEILHSKKYLDGEHLTIEDERAVVEKLLAYHPHSEDKTGCGLVSITVDRHPQFRQSRCLFVVRTDGSWIDFSYKKCLRSYIWLKYPSSAKKFFQEYYKRRSG